MENGIHLDVQSLESLYGPLFYYMDGIPQGLQGQVKVEAKKTPVDPAQGQSGASIQWRPKPTSKVLFVLHQAELRDKDLAELLKKIVASIGIPFEAAGFGIISGDLEEDPFASMPNPFAVVFDRTLGQGQHNPLQISVGEVFFSYRLSELGQNNSYKKELWEYLKRIQSQIS